MTQIRYVVMDCEATGVDVFEDRIVQFFIGWADSEGSLVYHREWIINPGVDVPQEAAEVHGFSTEYLKSNGRDAAEALAEIRDVLAGEIDKPWVLFNANYDLSILNEEFLRYGISKSFGEFVSDKVHVLDGIVIDRHHDRYRKGRRNLASQADHYGVPYDPEELHNAKADVELTAKVTVAILNKWGTPTTKEQAEWQEEWRAGFEKYLRKTDPTANVGRGWPLREKEDD